MKNNGKLLIPLAFAGLTASSIAVLNKFIFVKSTSKNLLNASDGKFYKWRLGNVFYTKEGAGKPILLIHDLNTVSSGYEYSKIVNELKKQHTVYTLDLLGCGRSDKQNLTYTNYLYVQLITDFVKNVITHRTDVIVSGASCSFVIMACNISPDIFDHIMMINPNSLSKCAQMPTRYSKACKLLLDTPIIGTLVYNIITSKNHLAKKFILSTYADPLTLTSEQLNLFHESAHTGSVNVKFLFSSICGHYTNIGVSSALKNIDNSIYLVGGAYRDSIKQVIDEYQTVNPAIESYIISSAKLYPHLETPKEFLSLAEMFFII